MDKPILKDSMTLFESLGKIKSRSMFGGFGLFADETMFALVVNDQLHIRADKHTSKEFEQKGFQPYIYKKRGFPVVTKYFSLTDDVSNNPDAILKMAKTSLSYAKEEKAEQSSAKPNRLKDLPNLRLATERMLKKAGIDSVEQLQEAGAAKAYDAIRQTHSSTVSLELLWALEGAINGTHWSVIPKQRREELITHLN